MARPRTVNAGIQDLPRGMRKVGAAWYWRGTDVATREVADRLRASGLSLRAGDTPIKARQWWARHVSPMLDALEPADTVAGTVEELVRRYEQDELPGITNASTRTSYEASLRRIRESFGARRYAKTPVDAMEQGCLRSPEIAQYLKDHDDKRNTASKTIRLLGRIFRLAISRWGLSTYNPVMGVEYAAQPPRDAYISDELFARMCEAAPTALRAMMQISQQTGARRGMVLDIRVGDIGDEYLTVRVTKKRSRSGVKVVRYRMTDDLGRVLYQALDHRPRPARPDIDHLFLTRNGLPYTGESFKRLWMTMRGRLGLESGEYTFHDIRAKAGSDADSDESAKQLLAHEDSKVTRRVYRRKPEAITPRPAVAGL